MTNKKEKYKKFKEFTTYHDIFSLALALASLKEFSSDRMDWHRALYEICQKYGKKIPELGTISFDHSRPPLPPMADEVHDLLSLLSMSGELEGLGLGKDAILRIPERARPGIIKDETKRLTKYAEEIKDMAKIFEKHLKVKSQR